MEENGDNDGVCGVVWMWHKPKLGQMTECTDGFKDSL